MSKALRVAGRLRFVWGAAAALLLTIEAAAAPEVQQQLQGSVDAVLKIVADKAQDGPAKRNAVREVGIERFALKQMSALVLGNAWKTLEPAKQNTFVAVFTDTLLDSYMRKIEAYSGETVSYGETVVTGKRATVATKLEGGEKAIPVVYKLFASDDQWLVYDVEIDGVSVVKTYRQQYAEFLQDKDVDALIQTMRDKLKAN